RAAQRDAVEVRTVVDLSGLRVGLRRWIVRDHIAIRGEAADHEQMTVRRAAEETGKGAVDGGDERDARVDEALRFVQRAEPGDEALAPEPRRPDDVGRPA